MPARPSNCRTSIVFSYVSGRKNVKIAPRGLLGRNLYVCYHVSSMCGPNGRHACKWQNDKAKEKHFLQNNHATLMVEGNRNHHLPRAKRQTQSSAAPLKKHFVLYGGEATFRTFCPPPQKENNRHRLPQSTALLWKGHEPALDRIRTFHANSIFFVSSHPPPLPQPS